MQIHCRHCRQPVHADDVNLDRMVAKCRSCHSVFDFSDQIKPAASPAPARPVQAARAEVPLPERLTVQWGDGGDFGGAAFRDNPSQRRDVAIVRRWFQPAKHLFLLVFAIVWNACMLFWYSAAIAGDGPWLAFVFPILHVAVGVGMGYGALTGLLNRTTIQIAGGVLRIRHGPLPWPGKRDMPADELDQLYVTQNPHHGKQGTTYTYDLKAALKSGQGVTLIREIPEGDQALYIEQAIESALGIVDVAMPGEFGA